MIRKATAKKLISANTILYISVRAQSADKSRFLRIFCLAATRLRLTWKAERSPCLRAIHLTITDSDGRSYSGSELFDFTVTEQNKTRNTADAVFTAEFLSRPLVGFINKCSEIKGISEPMFLVKLGLGNCSDGKGEGVRKNNLFCTHLTGPVLMKNPEFLTYMTKLVTGRDVEPNPLAVKGYEVTVRELNARIEQ